MSGQGQVKCNNEALWARLNGQLGYPLGSLGRLDGLQRGHSHPKCWIDVNKEYWISTKGILTKGQGQCQAAKDRHKLKVTNMPCDTCFLVILHADIGGDQSFNRMTSSSLTFDGGQVKVRLKMVKFSNQYFLHKKHMFIAQNIIRILNISLVFFYDA